MVKLLLDNGFVERRVNGSHHQLYKDSVRITVPIHGNQDLGKGLERKILKEAGIEKNSPTFKDMEYSCSMPSFKGVIA